MAKKKQGFIKSFLNGNVRLFRETFSFIPQIPSFVVNKKHELDDWSETARTKLKNPAKANFDLGIYFYEQNQAGDAITRFKLAGIMQKNYAEAAFWLGKAYILKSEFTKAGNALAEAKKLGYDSAEAAYFHEIYVAKNKDALSSELLQKDFFKFFGQIFDEYYCDNYRYMGYEKILETVTNHLSKQNANILEIGCGRGDLGVHLRTNFPSGKLVGIDKSEAMLDFAKEQEIVVKAAKEQDENIIITNQETEPSPEHTKNPYDYLVKKDFLEFSDPDNTKFDLLVARGAFNYIEDFPEVAAQAKKHIKKGGLFIFYLSHAYDQTDFGMVKQEFSFPYFLNHFTHSEDEVTKLLKKVAFKLETRQDFALDFLTKATVFVFKKN